MSNENLKKKRVAKRRSIARDARRSKAGIKDRWILSYADFITLLFAFFVALYSISLKNAGDSRLLSETLEGVFDAVQKSVKPISLGQVISGDAESEALLEVAPPEQSEPEDTDEVSKSEQEIETSEVTEELTKLIGTEFLDYQTKGLVSVSETEGWIEVDLKSSLLFSAGKSELTNEAVAVLLAISNILQKQPFPVLVEGHTDNLPISNAIYASNWHLSSARAASVVDELIYHGMNENKIAPIGFGSTRPKVRNANDFARAQNRRVTLKISKTEADNVYDYLFN